MNTQNSDPTISAIGKIADAIEKDVYVYNGAMARRNDLRCFEIVAASRSHEEATLVLVTNGRDPDAAYKIGRLFQANYAKFTVIISGLCKSAGTLLAVGASELAFTPYGELGPLDVQIAMADRFDELRSGLTISSALQSLENSATNKFLDVMRKLITDNQGLISIATATDAASKLVSAIYAPVFARIDPDELGARTRDMQIANDYGHRLAAWSGNVKPKALDLLAQTYSSHSFVIDKGEAETLFNNVRWTTAEEAALVAALGRDARFETSQAKFAYLNTVKVNKEAASGTEQLSSGSSTSTLGGDPANPVAKNHSEPRATRKRGGRRNGKDRPASEA